MHSTIGCCAHTHFEPYATMHVLSSLSLKFWDLCRIVKHKTKNHFPCCMHKTPQRLLVGAIEWNYAILQCRNWKWKTSSSSARKMHDQGQKLLHHVIETIITYIIQLLFLLLWTFLFQLRSWLLILLLLLWLLIVLLLLDLVWGRQREEIKTQKRESLLPLAIMQFLLSLSLFLSFFRCNLFAHDHNVMLNYCSS